MITLPVCGKSKILYFFGTLLEITLTCYNFVAFILYTIIYPIYFVTYLLPSKVFDWLCKVIESIPFFGPLFTWLLRSSIRFFIIYVLYTVIYSRLPIPVKNFIWDFIYVVKDLYVKVELKLFALLGNELMHEISNPLINSIMAVWAIIEKWINIYAFFGQAKQVLNVPEELYHGALDVKDKFFDAIYGFNENLEHMIPTIPSIPPVWNMTILVPSLPAIPVDMIPSIPSIPWNISIPSLPSIPWNIFGFTDETNRTSSNNGTSEL